MLQPLDILVGLKILTLDLNWTQMALAKKLMISSFSVNSALKELQRSKLLMKHEKHFFPIFSNWEEFLIASLKYNFVVESRELTIGIPTAYAAKPISDEIELGNDPPPVWSYPNGDTRGVSVEPLHPSVPEIVLSDDKDDFYQLLALVDTLRLLNSRAREKKIAEKILLKKLKDFKKIFESYI